MEARKAGEYGCNAIPVEINGKVYPNIAEAARSYGQKPASVRSRLYEGWTLEESLKIVPRQVKRVKSNASGTKIVVLGTEYRYIKDAAEEYGKPAQLIANRIKRGLTPEQALEIEPFPEWFVPGKGEKKALRDAQRADERRRQEELTGKRICSTCKKHLPFEEYHGSWETGTLASRCRHCVSAAFLKYRYGISLDDFNAMKQEQDGKCAICLTQLEIHPDSSVRTKKVAVDHCHETGKVRGLLCANCNTGLGMFKDNHALLQAASEYLLKQKSLLG